MQIGCFLKHKARILALHLNQSAIALCFFLILLRAPTPDRGALPIHLTDVDLERQVTCLRPHNFSKCALKSSAFSHSFLLVCSLRY